MPCRSDYLECNPLEKKGSIVYALLDELATGKHVNPQSNRYQGYDDRCYCNGSFNKTALDRITDKLCKKLSCLKPSEVKLCSLELQIWYRDHQKHDKERNEKQLKKKETDKIKKQALKKLTDKEKKALGVE